MKIIKIFKNLINHSQIQANSRDLFYACENNNYELAQYLFEKNIKPNPNYVSIMSDSYSTLSANQKRVLSCLSMACENQNLDMIKLLIKEGSDVKKDQFQALSVACYKQNKEIIEFLITQTDIELEENLERYLIKHNNKNVNITNDYLFGLFKKKNLKEKLEQQFTLKESNPTITKMRKV